MLDSLSVLVPSLSSLLILGGLFLVLVYLDSRFKIAKSSLQEREREIAYAKSLVERETLRAECLRLREALQNQDIELINEFQQGTFQELQSLLTNYPSVRQLVKVKPDLPAKNLTSLFTCLDNLMESWSYELVGQVWEQVAYDSQIHQPDAIDFEVGELVYVRFVGYRKGDRILVPAKVSRTLPAGLKN